MEKTIYLSISLILFNSCNLKVDDYELGKIDLSHNRYDEAKKQFEYVIQMNHPKKDSAELFIRAIDSIVISIEKEEEAKKMVTAISNASESINSLEELSKSKIADDVEGILFETSLYEIYRSEFNELEKFENEEAIKLAKALESKISKVQSIRFPKLRKKYGEVLDKKLWEHNIDVRSGNSRYTTLNLTGGTFASNANIKDFQITLTPQVKSLRFKQVRYRWYDGADEFQYYTLENPEDRELY